MALSALFQTLMKDLRSNFSQTSHRTKDMHRLRQHSGLQNCSWIVSPTQNSTHRSLFLALEGLIGCDLCDHRTSSPMPGTDQGEYLWVTVSADKSWSSPLSPPLLSFPYMALKCSHAASYYNAVSQISKQHIVHLPRLILQHNIQAISWIKTKTLQKSQTEENPRLSNQQANSISWPKSVHSKISCVSVIVWKSFSLCGNSFISVQQLQFLNPFYHFHQTQSCTSMSL